VLRVKGTIEERAEQLALYIIENQATVRSAAKQFGISKSTVHKDISDRLPAYNRPLYLQVKKVLDRNKAERHLRGGLATRKKYKGV
jgi:putative DeoR family transcriptional regulator (stage III sporulation protein D)